MLSVMGGPNQVSKQRQVQTETKNNKLLTELNSPSTSNNHLKWICNGWPEASTKLFHSLCVTNGSFRLRRKSLRQPQTTWMSSTWAWHIHNITFTISNIIHTHIIHACLAAILQVKLGSSVSQLTLHTSGWTSTSKHLLSTASNATSRLIFLALLLVNCTILSNWQL